MMLKTASMVTLHATDKLVLAGFSLELETINLADMGFALPAWPRRLSRLESQGGRATWRTMGYSKRSASAVEHGANNPETKDGRYPARIARALCTRLLFGASGEPGNIGRLVKEQGASCQHPVGTRAMHMEPLEAAPMDWRNG